MDLKTFRRGTFEAQFTGELDFVVHGEVLRITGENGTLHSVKGGYKYPTLGDEVHRYELTLTGGEFQGKVLSKGAHIEFQYTSKFNVVGVGFCYGGKYANTVVVSLPRSVS